MKNVLSHGHKSKTVMFNAIRGLVDAGIFTVLLSVDWTTAGFSPKVAVWVALGLSMFDKIANLYLRSVTTTALEDK